jgi:hypothetical protein
MNHCLGHDVDYQILKTVDWISVALQWVDFDHSGVSGLVKYKSNRSKVLLPTGDPVLPPGPGALRSSIIVDDSASRFFPEENSGEAEIGHALIARELSRAIEALRVIVPACQDWRRYWTAFLRKGEMCTLVETCSVARALYYDDSSTGSHEDMMYAVWGSQATHWLNLLEEIPCTADANSEQN